MHFNNCQHYLFLAQGYPSLVTTSKQVILLPIRKEKNSLPRFPHTCFLTFKAVFTDIIFNVPAQASSVCPVVAAPATNHVFNSALN